MSLREEVLAESTRPIGIKEALKEYGQELVDLLNDDAVTGAAIAVVLRRRGYDISDRAVQRYRQRMRENGRTNLESA